MCDALALKLSKEGQIHVCHLCFLPVHEHQQGEAAEPPGQSGGRVQVLPLGGGAREQEDLGGVLVGELRGLD